MANSLRHRLQVFRIAAAQDWKCYWCGWTLTEETVTRDHLVPRSQGGSNRAQNIVAACSPCNQKRGSGTAPPAQYLVRRALQIGSNLALRPIRFTPQQEGPTRAEKTKAKRERRAVVKKWKAQQGRPTLADVWPNSS